MAKVTNLSSGSIQAADPVMQHFELKTQDGRLFTVIGGSHRIVIEDNQKPIGIVVRSSHWSGSIWKNDQCVGEYYFLDGNYRVVPISDGVLSSDRSVEVHPIDFLLA